MRADNTHHLTDAAARCGHDSRRRVLAVLQISLQRGEQLTVTRAATAAGVSRAYLYFQPDLIAAVRELQQANGGRPPGALIQQHASAASLLARIKTLAGRNLREENRQLRRPLEVAHGRLRDTGAGSVPLPLSAYPAVRRSGHTSNSQGD